MQRKYFFILVCAFIFMETSCAHAQSVVPDPVQYTIAPETPGPGQTVNIEVSGVGQFLGNSSITWQQDGKTLPAANNKRSFSFTAGGIGTPTHIHITIDSPTQGLIEHDFYFNPSTVSLVWEADTYTPLNYRGKALYTAGSNVTVAAYPTVLLSGKVIPPSKLSFQWYRNDSLVPESSGLGKDTFTFQGDQLKAGEDVAVDVYSGPLKVARGTVSIPVSSPQVVLYVQDPLRGELLDQAIQGSASLSQTEVTLKAEPYFFASNRVKNGGISYAWTLNDQETSGPQSAQGLLTLRQTGSGTGSADLSVSAQNTDTSQYAQQAGVSLRVIFGQTSGSALSSFFGL